MFGAIRTRCIRPNTRDKATITLQRFTNILLVKDHHRVEVRESDNQQKQQGRVDQRTASKLRAKSLVGKAGDLLEYPSALWRDLLGAAVGSDRAGEDNDALCKDQRYRPAHA